MGAFTIEIAGKALQVHSLFESTGYYFQNYRTDRLPDFTVTVSPQELAGEQEALREEAWQEGLKPRHFPEPFLERSVIQRKVAGILLDSGVLLFHGSAVAVDGEAYLFTANCGTGKSTHTRLWRQVFGDRAIMVNDDKPFLKVAEAGVFACGSPWSGKHGLDTNVALPLRGICILERGRENRIWPISPEEALPMLKKQGGAPADPEKQAPFHDLTERLSQSVPLWRMTCTKDPQAAVTAYEAMSGKLLAPGFP